MVMVEWDTQMPAHVGKLRRIDAPRGPGEADRAFEWVGGWLDASAFAARFQYRPIEARVVRRQKIDALKLHLEMGPQFSKRRSANDIVPGDAVQVRKDEVFPRRANQVVNTADNAVPLDPNDRHRARAVASVVRGLEVDGRKDGLSRDNRSCLLHAGRHRERLAPSRAIRGQSRD